MDTHVLERLKQDYRDNEDVIQLYEEWGDSDYLKEIFAILDKRQPEWNLERELGSWAAEFILDILEEYEEELERMSREEVIHLFEEEIDERYADCKSGHQFARVNNLSMQFDEDETSACEDLDDYIAEDGEKEGFPVIR